MQFSVRKIMENRSYRLCGLLAVVGLIITLAAVLGGAHVREGYAIGVGTVSPIRFRAPYQMINPYQTAINREDAERSAESVVPVLERDIHVAEVVASGIGVFFESATLGRLIYREALTEYFEAIEALVQSNETYLAPPQEGEYAVEAPVFPDPLEAASLPIHLSDAHIRTIIEMNEDDFEQMYYVVTEALAQILEDGIQYVDMRVLLNIQELLAQLNQEVSGLAFEIASSYVQPNIFENEEETSIIRQRVASDYDTVYFQQGQMIIDADELITQEAFMALETLGLVRAESSLNVPLISGAALLTITIYGTALAFILLFCKNCFDTERNSISKEALLFFTLYASTIGITWIVSQAPGNIPYPFVPIIAFTMLLVIFFKLRLGLVMNIATTIIASMIMSANIEFVAFFVLMGIISSMVASYTTTRSRIMFAGASITLISAVAYLGISLFFARSISEATLMATGFSALAGLLTVVLAVGSAPFWEAVFGLVTPFRLIDLANPNHPILRKLAIEAPGTYHHSLIVANLAEAAAHEIGANTYLTRAGSYFHDIGKMKYPAYFAENQGSENPHDNLPPEESCRILSSHIEYGLELVRKNRLPKAITGIIEQHHGNTLMKFFYHRARKQAEEAGAEPPDEANYRYGFRTPQSREAAVIMLADTVEAAVRSKAHPSFQEIEELVRVLVKDKIDDGQLIDSGLTLRDIESATQAFLRVFRAMNHERIAYPTVS